MFAFTSQEQKALFFVAAALALSLALRWVLPHRDRPELYDYSLRDSLFKALSADTLHPAMPFNVKDLNKMGSVVREKTPSAAYKKKRTHQKLRLGKKRVLKSHSININTASVRELEKLPGIGPKTAQAIVDYRHTHGPFTRLDELKKVKRIGPKTLKKIESYIFLGKGKMK